MFGSPDYYSNPWAGMSYPYGQTVPPQQQQQQQFPMQQQQPQQQSQQQPQQNNISMAFIHGGDAAADGYLMAPNQTILLIDNEAGMIYIKETNGSGMQITNRKFKEEKQASLQQLQADFVTRDEFEKRIAELANVSKSVPTA